ncbi:hypothetical protein GCM10010145_06880 [Streptomyces ruber]|uniref:Uncharacterized protein n=2 Tax=Streptomyces TaxID=1883 RepID=A0A918B7D1_9ACTN|nr:hypothetical protein GCM10010145_06880 [Streptomyces ruber]
MPVSAYLRSFTAVAVGGLGKDDLDVELHLLRRVPGAVRVVGGGRHQEVRFRAVACVEADGHLSLDFEALRGLRHQCGGQAGHDAAVPRPLRRHHEDERSVDQLGVAGRLGKAVQVLREPSFRARRPHPVGQGGHGTTVATWAGSSREFLDEPSLSVKRATSWSL